PADYRRRLRASSLSVDVTSGRPARPSPASARVGAGPTGRHGTETRANSLRGRFEVDAAPRHGVPPPSTTPSTLVPRFSRQERVEASRLLVAPNPLPHECAHARHEREPQSDLAPSLTQDGPGHTPQLFDGPSRGV